MSQNITVNIIVLCYLAAMVLIGFIASKRIKNDSDFLVAGRTMGPILLAGGLAATELGGGTSIGIVEKAYGEWGLSSIWYIITMAITFIVLAFIAPVLRGVLVKTVPEFFHKRYGEANGFVTTIILILPMIGLAAAQIIASSTILTVMTGWDFTVSTIVVTVVVVAYSTLGGMFALAYTDIVQIVIIVLGMILVIPFALSNGGGWEYVTSSVPAEKWSLFDGMGIGTMIGLTVMYIGSFTVGQEVVQRYYSAKDAKAARNASYITSAMYIFFAFVPAIIGILLYGMVQNGTIDSAILSQYEGEYALPVMAMEVLPSFVIGILFAALISATMSSASSDLMAAASLFSNDIYKRYIKKSANSKEILKATKIAMLIVGILGFFVAISDFGSIIELLMFSFALRAGGAFLPFLIGHFWNKPGAIASMLSLVFGSLAVAGVENGVIPFFGLDPILLGLPVSAIFFFGATYIWPNKNKSFNLEYEKENSDT